MGTATEKEAVSVRCPHCAAVCQFVSKGKNIRLQHDCPVTSRQYTYIQPTVGDDTTTAISTITKDFRKSTATQSK